MVSNELKTEFTPEVLIKVREIIDQVSISRSTRLARGNINVQRGGWMNTNAWNKMVEDHPKKLQYLVDTLATK